MEGEGKGAPRPPDGGARFAPEGDPRPARAGPSPPGPDATSRLVRLAIDRAGLVLAGWALLTAVASVGVARLEFATAPSSFLDRLAPEWGFYQASLERFGGDEIVVVALASDPPWDPAVLADVARLTRELEALPGVRRVDSLSTVPIVRVRSDGVLDLSPALPAHPPTEPGLELAARVREAIAGDRIVPGSLVGDEGRSFALNVILDAGPSEAEDGAPGDAQAAIVEAAYAALDGRRGWVSGVPVYEYRVGESTGREILTFVPVTLALMAVLLWLAFGSVVALLVPGLTSGIGAWLILGAMGALGEPVTLTGMILPSVLLALGCAYVMHLLVAARGVRGADTLERALAPVVAPLAISGLTTAVGFFAIMTIRIDAIASLGLFGGVGVLVVLLAALSLGPALLARWPLPERRAPLHGWIRARLTPALLGFLVRRRVGVMLAWAALLAVSAFGAARIHVETDAVLWWPPGSEMRTHYDEIRDRLSGISPMNVVIESQGERRVIAPEVLSRIDGLAAHLAAHPKVGKVLSVADPLRQLHGGFVDDPSQPLPDSERLAAQYLLLLDSVDPIRDVISFDRFSANVLIRADDNGSRTLLDVAKTAESWWAEHGAPDFEARATGIMFEFARSEEAIAWGQIRGLSLALLAIGLILLVLFRDWLVAAIALVPNVASLSLIYGWMGLAGIPLDGGTVCMGTLALGIAVDDTIHVLNGYRLRRAAGASARSALAGSYDHVMPALVLTSLAISVGFAALTLSDFLLTRNLGLVTAVVVAICLVADTTLLPAVLLGDDDEDGEPG